MVRVIRNGILIELTREEVDWEFAVAQYGIALATELLDRAEMNRQWKRWMAPGEQTESDTAESETVTAPVSDGAQVAANGKAPAAPKGRKKDTG